MTTRYWDLYDTAQDAVETTEMMTQAEAHRRNAELRSWDEALRWVPSVEDIDGLTYSTNY
jgi:hypothetical protein